MTVSDEIKRELVKRKVKGLFFVRQKRIPTILGQGLSIGIDSSSYIPTLFDGNNYITEGFLDKEGMLTSNYRQRMLETPTKQSSGLLCMDACVSPITQSILDGSDFVLQQLYRLGDLNEIKDRHYEVKFKYKEISKNALYNSQAVFVNSDVPAKIVNDFSFCTRAGSEEDIKSFGFFGERNYEKDSNKLVRGVYCPFVGTTELLEDNSIYNIRVKGYSSSYLREYFKVRGNDNAPFYATTDRFEIDNIADPINVYRGDCYTNTVTFRINRNFVDSSVPVNDLIVDTKT